MPCREADEDGCREQSSSRHSRSVRPSGDSSARRDLPWLPQSSDLCETRWRRVAVERHERWASRDLRATVKVTPITDGSREKSSSRAGRTRRVENRHLSADAEVFAALRRHVRYSAHALRGDRDRNDECARDRLDIAVVGDDSEQCGHPGNQNGGSKPVRRLGDRGMKSARVPAHDPASESHRRDRERQAAVQQHGPTVLVPLHVGVAVCKPVADENLQLTTEGLDQLAWTRRAVTRVPGHAVDPLGMVLYAERSTRKPPRHIRSGLPKRAEPRYFFLVSVADDRDDDSDGLVPC